MGSTWAGLVLWVLVSPVFGLSPNERDQLGTFKQLKSGAVSEFAYPSRQQWPLLRKWLVQRSLKAKAVLDLDLTAYTPGETLELLEKPAIRRWHRDIVGFNIPRRFRRIVFVPCAKTKPWDVASSKRSALYRSYHEVLEQLGEESDVYFVTLSEPLGIVPQDFWGSFPQYDNPGLFRDDAQRAGALLSDWLKSPFGKKMIVPFDEAAYSRAVERLGGVIAEFVAANHFRGREYFSFVDEVSGSTTHGDMLTAALVELRKTRTIAVKRFLKRPAPRAAPCQYILENIK